MKNSSSFCLLKASCLTLILFSFDKANAYSYKETNIEVYLSNIKKLGQKQILKVRDKDFQAFDSIALEIKNQDTLDYSHQKKSGNQLSDHISQDFLDIKKEDKKRNFADLQNNKKIKLKIKTKDIVKKNDRGSYLVQKTMIDSKEKITENIAVLPAKNVDFTSKTLEVADTENQIITENLGEVNPPTILENPQNNENLGKFVKEVESLSKDNNVQDFKADFSQNEKNFPEKEISEVKSSYQNDDIIVNNLNQSSEAENNNLQK